MSKHFPIITILVLATALRIIAVCYYPAGLNADEAALGYNAYSLLLTGKDEHGNLFPVNLESFSDYKPALYAYLLIPVVKVLGLTEFAVRLPSAFFGVLAIFLIYVISKFLFGNLTFENLLAIGDWQPARPAGGLKIEEIAALLLAISPWHLHFSRGAWEVNLATTLILLGTICFLRWTQSQKLVHFTFCILTFVLSMYTYQSARVLAPALGISLAVLYAKKIIANFRQSVLVCLLLLLLLIPLIVSLISTPAVSRAGGVGLLADEGPVSFVNELRGQYSGPLSILGRFLHNRPVIYTFQFIKNYLVHFDGNFLFVSGDEIQRNRVPETGLLYFTDFVLLTFGFFYLANNTRLKTKRLIFIWLFIAPVASALTFQVPHALRAQNLVIPLTLIMAAGIVQYFRSFEKNKKLLLLLLLFTYGWQFARYLHQYYIHYPQTYPTAWEYGFRDLVTYIRANQDRYSRVIITDKYDQPYILFLFYASYDPRRFQSHHELSIRDRYNFSTVREFDKYIFTDTNWDKVRDQHGSLIAAAGDDIPPVGVNIVKIINFPGGQPAFKIISN